MGTGSPSGIADRVILGAVPRDQNIALPRACGYSCVPNAAGGLGARDAASPRLGRAAGLRARREAASDAGAKLQSLA